jgi:hypothetical protein
LYGHKAGDLPKHGNISGTINVWCLLPQKQKHLIFFAINHMVNPFWIKVIVGRPEKTLACCHKYMEKRKQSAREKCDPGPR